jgi:antitoxin ParD1/3/4
MVKKSISVTEQQDGWIKAQIQTGHFGNESEVIRELIRERQPRESETPAEIEAIRAALIHGEPSGFSNRGVDEIWEDTRRAALQSELSHRHPAFPAPGVRHCSSLDNPCFAKQ